MTKWLPRWYWMLVPVLFTAGQLPYFGYIIAFFYMELRIGYIDTTLSDLHPLFMWISITSIFITALWIVIACPVLASADTHAHWEPKPHEKLNGLKVLIWLPSTGLVAGGLVGAIGMPIEEWWTTGRWMFDSSIRLFLATSGVGVVLMPIVYKFSQTIQKRFNRTMTHLGICTQCAYDLRGNPDAEHCPECGAAIEKIP